MGQTTTAKVDAAKLVSGHRSHPLTDPRAGLEGSKRPRDLQSSVLWVHLAVASLKLAKAVQAPQVAASCLATGP